MALMNVSWQQCTLFLSEELEPFSNSFFKYPDGRNYCGWMFRLYMSDSISDPLNEVCRIAWVIYIGSTFQVILHRVV